jgi:hypothetical protein
MKRIIFTTGLMLFGAEALAYDSAFIKNNTDYWVSGKVHYGDPTGIFCKDDTYKVKPGGTWRDSGGRGACLIQKISGSASGSAKHGESTSIVEYTSTGTGYSRFQVNAFGGRYRIFSDQEYKKASKQSGRSPGFKLVNKTIWPVAYSFEQVGCLYHDVIPAKWNNRDGVKVIDTGAVWFTLRAHIQPDGKNPKTDWDCVKPVAEIVGDVLLATASVAATAATGGAAAPATGAVLAKIVAKAALKEAVKVSVKTISKHMAKQIGEYLSDAGTVTMAGQYAGYDWPFRCNNMPEYHITGGPGFVRDDAGAIYLTPAKTTFTVRKVNTCGNDMMLASPKSSSAKANLSIPKIAGNTTGGGTPPKPVPTPRPVSGGSVAATVYQHCNFGGYGVTLSAGRYTLRQLQARGIKNDDLSSLRMRGGGSIRMYQHDNFQGQSWLFNSDNSCFVNNKMNDVVSSIVVTAPKSSVNLETSCFNSVQGKVAWSRGGSKQWGANNIKKLCAQTRNPSQTIACFKQGIASHNNWQKAIGDCAKRH